MRASFSPQSELGAGLGIGSPSRGRNPLSCALYATCSPGDSGHTDLPSPPPSSILTMAVATECSQIGTRDSNCHRGSRSLPDLTGQFAPRADDGHAPPLGSSGKIFSLAFILPSLPVMFPALNPIEPQHPPLVVLPRQFL